MIMAAKGVNDAQIFHILKENLFFLSGVALMQPFSRDITIIGTKSPKQICSIIDLSKKKKVNNNKITVIK